MRCPCAPRFRRKRGHHCESAATLAKALGESAAAMANARFLLSAIFLATARRGSLSSVRMSAREAATHLARRLKAAGHVAFFAGGCVRDRLLGHEPQDFDIATSARPEQVLALFPGANEVGAHFGVVIAKHGGHPVEIATFRTDGSYRDARRPESVTFSTPDADARRRDFTINGLFEHPETGEVVD